MCCCNSSRAAPLVAGAYATCQNCKNLLTSTKSATGGLLYMATRVAIRDVRAWQFAVRGFEPRARAKTKNNLKTCKMVRHLEFAGVFGRYEKDATHAWHMDTNGVAVGDVVEREALFQRRSEVPSPIYGLLPLASCRAMRDCAACCSQ